MSKKTIIIILFSICIMAAQLSKAAVINVTTTQDNEPGSLRAAITEANRNGQDNVINLPGGRYYLGHGANENRNKGGDLDINTNKSITIRGVRLTIISPAYWESMAVMARESIITNILLLQTVP